MSLDDFIKKMQPQNENKPLPIVAETMKKGIELINVDYLNTLLSNEELKSFLQEEKQMNLYERGWRFQFGKSKQWAGLCDPRPESVLKSKDKNILVSIDFVKGDDNWQKNSINTILHEIAHAIVCEIFYFGKFTFNDLKNLDPKHFKTKGHGEIWEKVCKTINPEGNCGVFYSDLRANDFFKNFRYFCINCKHKEYSDAPNFAKRCIKCFKPVIVEGNI
jgi:hypothetical protein